MRIVLNTHADDAATSVCIEGLGARLQERGIDATINDWSGYAGYDVAVFMGYDHELERARRERPGIRVLLADPKLSRPDWLEAARSADGLLVSSVEQRDAFQRINRNILIYFMFPPMRPVHKEHVDKEPIVIGYHGNRVHLEAMVGGARAAIEELGRRQRIELWALYNVSAVGRAQLGLPDESLVPVRHIQWTPDREPGTAVSARFYDELAQVDIGIVPNELPIKDRLDVLELSAYRQGELMYEPFDHLVRFKVSANPGRIYPFAQLGIPVVADFTPSAGQFVVDGESGVVASSASGWFEGLAALAASADLRTRLAAGLRSRVDAAYERQLDDFVAFCRAEPKGAPPVFPEQLAAEAEFVRLDRYLAPGGRGRRVLHRLGRRRLSR